MKNESTGERLQRLREARNLNPYRLGKLAKVDPGYIARIESGKIKNPGIPVLRKLSNSLNITLTELIGEAASVPAVPNTNKSATKASHLLELKKILEKLGVKELKIIGKAISIPVRGYIRAKTTSAIEHNEGETVIVSSSLVESLTCQPKDVYSLRVSGESLSGDGIHTGDSIFVLQTRNFDIDGKLYIIRDPRSGENVVRHLYRKNGRIRVESLNPDYEPLLLDQVEVFGKVIYIQPEGKAV